MRYYLAFRMADKGLVSAPNAVAGVPFQIGGQPVGVYPIGPETGLSPVPVASPPPINTFVREPEVIFEQGAASPFDQLDPDASLPEGQ